MTKTEVLNKIQTWIVTNGANEITAEVLRPILEDILNQPNGLIGLLSQLKTPASDLVTAINKLEESIGEGLVIHTGSNDPNVTPPATYSIGDFYNRVVNGSNVAFYIFNGQDWAILKQDKANVKKIRTTVVSTTFEADDTTIIYIGSSSGVTIGLPNPAGASGRIITFVNRSNYDVGSNLYIRQVTGESVSKVWAGSAATLQSDGRDWYQITNY